MGDRSQHRSRFSRYKTRGKINYAGDRCSVLVSLILTHEPEWGSKGERFPAETRASHPALLRVPHHGGGRLMMLALVVTGNWMRQGAGCSAMIVVLRYCHTSVRSVYRGVWPDG